MNNKIIPANRYKWLFILIILTILIGIFFRINNINLKPYWHDEVYTSLYISGHTGKEVIKELSNKVITHENILKYQCPSTETNLFDTIKVLAQEDPQHPPLFYGLEAIWVKLFGCSIATMRSLSILFSLCLLPSIYLLCQELFNKPLVSWIATALVSISPIQIRYAQEARQYSLFAFLTVLSSWILLKAVKKNTLFLWVCYTISTSLLLYCHLLSAFVLIGQIIFILALGKNSQESNQISFNSLNITKTKKILRNYILALSIALISFSPWLKILIIGKKTAENKTGWLAQNIDFLSLIEKWSLNLSKIFVSWNYELNYWLIYLSIPLWILVLYSFYYLFKKNYYLVWIFIFSLIGTTVGILATIDLLRTGKSSTFPNYLLPSFLGIQICVAYLLGTKINSELLEQKNALIMLKKPLSFDKYQRKDKTTNVWSIITVVILTGGIISSTNDFQAQTWWNWSKFDVEAAKIINKASNPLVISEASLGAIAPLTYLVDSSTNIMLINSGNLKVKPDYQNIFFYQIPDDSLLKISKNLSLAIDTVYHFEEDSLIVKLFKLKTNE